MTTPHPTPAAASRLAMAEKLARSLYGLEARATALDGYVYLNFRLDAADGTRFVLKIAPENAEEASVALPVDALSFLHKQAPSLAVPRPVPGSDGRYLQRADSRQLFALEWMDGVLMDRAKRRPALLRSVGHITARLHRALEGFSHPGLNCHCAWDLRHALSAREHLRCITDRKRRAQVSWILDRFEARVTPVFSTLRQGPIHGDLNDHNILVKDDEVTGILDFGDITTSALVADLAIAAAYAMFHTPDPFDAAAQLFAAYQQTRPLRENELMLVPEMIATRLAFSVTMSAHRVHLGTDDPYVLVAEKPAWATLELMDKMGLDRLRDDILRACNP